MSLAFKKAQEHFNGISHYPAPVKLNESRKINYTDGDFEVSVRLGSCPCYDLFGLGMFSKTKIPELDLKTYDRILAFAKKRNFEIKHQATGKCPYYCFQNNKNNPDLQLAESSLQLTLDIQVEIKNNFWGRKTKTETITEMCVGNHFFTATEPKIFEDFGREVCDLKTQNEIGRENRIKEELQKS